MRGELLLDNAHPLEVNTEQVISRKSSQQEWMIPAQIKTQ